MTSVVSRAPCPSSPPGPGRSIPKVRVGRVDLALVLAVLLAACGHLLIKYGLSAASFHHEPLAERVIRYLLLPRILLGLLIYGAGTVLWIAVVAKREISYVYPITSLNYVLVGVGGIWLFGEPVSWVRWIGIAVVVLGVALLQTSARGQES